MGWWLSKCSKHSDISLYHCDSDTRSNFCQNNIISARVHVCLHAAKTSFVQPRDIRSGFDFSQIHRKTCCCSNKSEAFVPTYVEGSLYKVIHTLLLKHCDSSDKTKPMLKCRHALGLSCLLKLCSLCHFRFFSSFFFVYCTEKCDAEAEELGEEIGG